MELTLQRVRLFKDRTAGQMYVDGTIFCFVLEDPVREVEGQPVEKWKIKGETAIPSGTYRVTLENSPKFGPNTLTVNAVPGFIGIRMHSGITEHDTEGCLILGYKATEVGMIVPGSTRPAVVDLKKKVGDAIAAGEKVILRILNPLS